MASLIHTLLNLRSSSNLVLRLVPNILNSRFVSHFAPLQLVFPVGQRDISTSAIVLAEPLKKKKKLDPAVVRAREDRKKRKLEKQIRRLEKHQRQLKPLDELEIPICLIDEPKLRQRKLPQLPTAVIDARWKLSKVWGIYKMSQAEAEVRFFQKIRRSQEMALEELRKESESLYDAAVQIDPNVIPYEVKGPTDTPAIENYSCPNGDYIDVSKNWD